MYFLAAIGAIFIFVAVSRLFDICITKKKCTQTVEGELVGIRTYSSMNRYNSKEVCYAAVYGYTIDGIDYTFSPKKFVKYSEMYEVGSKVEVRYNPNNPNECVVGRDDRVGLVIVLTILGAALLAIDLLH